MDKLWLMIWLWEMIKMIYHFASQWQSCQLLIFLQWKEIVKSGAVQSQVEHMMINF